MPDIIEYNAGKFALIFGSLLIFEQIISIPYLGYIANKSIIGYQAGFVISFFFFINLLVIIINVLAKILIYLLSPILRRKA